MPDAYSYARARVAATLSRMSTGTITLTRTTRADPSPATPHIPGAATTATYTLVGRADGTAGSYADGVTILATDRMVIASPKATLSGAVVDIVPRMTDVLAIDGKVHAIKKIDAVPAAGTPARFHIFIAS